MDKEYYKDIEKIKTIGSTYMAAVGLVPTSGSKVRRFYVTALCEGIIFLQFPEEHQKHN